MDDHRDAKSATDEDTTKARRAFLRKAATYGAVTPAAVSLLLSASPKRAQAGRDTISPPPER